MNAKLQENKRMLSVVIIDDEQDAITVLTQLLKKYTKTPLKILGTANDLDEGIDLIKKTKPNVVLLDVEMPRKKGLEIYRYFEKPLFKIIFATAYNQYAIEAIKKSASDYILKPIVSIELFESLDKVHKEIEREQKQLEVEDKVNMLVTPEMEGKNVVLDVEGGFIVENSKNIEYCYADESYSVIVTYLGKKITVAKPLKELELMLPDSQFYRTHKSYLVNIFYIRKYTRAQESSVLLKSGVKIPVSVRNSTKITNDIKQLLQN